MSIKKGLPERKDPNRVNTKGTLIYCPHVSNFDYSCFCSQTSFLLP